MDKQPKYSTNKTIITSHEIKIISLYKNGKINLNDQIIIKSIGSSPNFDVFLVDKNNPDSEGIKIGIVESSEISKILKFGPVGTKIKGNIYNIKEGIEYNLTDVINFPIEFEQER
jgi:hypothetical protein